MRISAINNNNSFKGYDARPLKGVIMNKNCLGIADEMAEIGKKEGFKIFTVIKDKFVATPPIYSANTDFLWAQDYWTILPHKLLANNYNSKFETIKRGLGLSTDFTEKIAHQIQEYNDFNNSLINVLYGNKQNKEKIAKEKERLLTIQEDIFFKTQKTHIQGGNSFIIKGTEKDELIIGKNELEKFDIDEICAMYNVDKVTVLPQMDYHLDLFIRPLDNKRILLTDDNMTLNIIKEACENLRKFIDEFGNSPIYNLEKIYSRLTQNYANFSNIVSINNRPKAEEIEKILTDNGYEVIKVPGRVYKYSMETANSDMNHLCNYINAVALKNNNDNLVYITNHSKIENLLGVPKEIAELIGFNFEKSFIKSIEKYVDKEHIYFINGKQNVISTILTKLQGGIHCMCCEIPDTIKINENNLV